MNKHSQRIQKPVDAETLLQAEAVYLSVWNMDCPDCAIWLHNGLIQLDNVLIVDVFYKQGVAVIIYAPEKVTPCELMKVIQKIGERTCHYYGAEIIGQCLARHLYKGEEYNKDVIGRSNSTA